MPLAVDCPERLRVHLYVDGELSTEEKLEVRDHVVNCAACQRELEDALQLAVLAQVAVAGLSGEG